MQPTNSAEKELLKESLYRTKMREVLGKHRGILQAAYNPSPEVLTDTDDPTLIKKQYAAESAIIQRVMANERAAFLSGIALSGLVFASIRFGPRYLAIKINPDKARILKEADEIAEKANTRWIQKTAAFLFEASFGAWAGWRGYNIVSSQNKSSYEEISKIPLCAGRSSVSEHVCADWVNLVHKEIPKSFWSNLDHGEECRLNDPQRWRSVRDFSDNCIKRKVYEDSYRKHNGMSPGTPVVVPEGGVPDDILLSITKKTYQVDETTKG
ncbi:hypothetical protein ACHAXR_012105 [Thalassiosira sp. AJA248-18]